MTELPQPGQRIALRYRDASGPRELIGYVRGAGPEGLSMLDRTLGPRLLAWESLESWRAVPQVPRGRNPAAADPALLDRMAGDDRLVLPGAAAADSGSGGGQDLCQVARLAEVLGPAVPTQGPEAYDLGDGLAEHRQPQVAARAIAVGEWATIRVTDIGGADGPPGEPSASAALLAVVLPLARWAAYRDARNVQVRGTGVRLAGFTELRRT